MKVITAVEASGNDIVVDDGKISEVKIDLEQAFTPNIEQKQPKRKQHLVPMFTPTGKRLEGRFLDVTERVNAMNDKYKDVRKTDGKRAIERRLKQMERAKAKCKQG